MVVPCVSDISDFYAAQYVNEEKIVRFYNSLGQKVPSRCMSIPSCQTSHEIGTEGVNFTGVTVLLSSDNINNCVKAKKYRKRYKRGSLEVSKREKQCIEIKARMKRHWILYKLFTLSGPRACTTLSLHSSLKSMCVLELQNHGMLSILPCSMLTNF